METFSSERNECLSLSDDVLVFGYDLVDHDGIESSSHRQGEQISVDRVRPYFARDHQLDRVALLPYVLHQRDDLSDDDVDYEIGRASCRERV